MTRRPQPRRWGATLACLAAFAVTVAYAPALATGGSASKVEPQDDVPASVEKRDAESAERPIGPYQSKAPKAEDQAAGGEQEPSETPAEQEQSTAPQDQSKSSGRPIGPQPGHSKPDPPGDGGAPPGQNEPPKSDPGQGKTPTGNEPNPGGNGGLSQGKGPLSYEPDTGTDDGQGKGPDGSPPDDGQGKAPTAERPQSEEPPTRAERQDETSLGSEGRPASTRAADPSASTEAQGGGGTSGASPGAGDATPTSVTGLANRIAFEHQLALDWQRSLRYDRPLGLIMIDLDDFKRTNDTRGHVAGDRVLRDTAETVAREIRGGDVAARIGGDEFVVIAAETTGYGLQILSRRLGRALDERGIAASVGCAERTEDDGAGSDVVERADNAMYEDKQQRKSVGIAAARG